MIDRLVSLVMAVCLALLIWLYARSREQDTLDNVPLPVELTLAPRQADLFSLEAADRQVVVSFTGPPQRIRELHLMLQRRELHVVKTLTVPDDRLSESRYSDAIEIEAADINAPVGVNVIALEGRNRVPFVLHRMIEKRLPVRFDNLRESLTSGPVLIEPATVLVRGPRELLDRVQFIPTQPSELPVRPVHLSSDAAAIGRVPLVEELEGRPVRVSPPHVQVRVPGKARKLYELTDVQVQFLCPPNFMLRPRFIDERSGKVNLKLLGPASEEAPKVQVFIDLSKGKFVSGLNHEPLQLQLPREYQLAQDPPRVVAFELLPGDFVPEGLGLSAPPAAPPPRD
ncbi:MAG: hypothetical protein U0840_11930 [Gemmataceae bacterium]